jgi:hypothetical protein
MLTKLLQISQNQMELISIFKAFKSFWASSQTL